MSPENMAGSRGQGDRDLQSRFGKYLWPGVVALGVGALGWIEGWYGRIFYSADALGYLDITEAIRRADWKTAFSPYWGVLYSLILAVIRPLFAPGAQGEWIMIRVLSIAVLALLMISFAWLFSKLAGRERLDWVAATAILTSFAIGGGNVSRVSADPLLAALVFISFALLMRLRATPGFLVAALLGLCLGAGYASKAAFFPFAVMVLAAMAIALRWKGLRFTSAACAAFLLVALPYAAAVSWAYGKPTLSETGPLNYAWYVNGLMRSVHWQGGPPQFGAPVHPTRALARDLPVFEFAKPFPVTYPPFFNPPYWYEGYRHFVNWRDQLKAIAVNVRAVLAALVRNPLMYVLAGLVIAALLRSQTENRKQAWHWLRAQWPVLLPSAGAIGVYLLVHVEERHIMGYLATLAALAALFAKRCAGPMSRRAEMRVAVLLVLGVAADLAVRDGLVFKRMVVGEDYTTHDAWKAGMALRETGLRPGDQVSTVSGPAYYAEWAHVSRVHIISELAGPDDDEDFFWKLPPEKQVRVLEDLRGTGAAAAIATRYPGSEEPAGWRRLGTSASWVYWFRPTAEEQARQR